MNVLKKGIRDFILLLFELGDIRQLTHWKSLLFICLGFFMSIYQIWSVLFAKIEAINQMSIHFSFILMLTFFLYSFSKKVKSNQIFKAIDIFLIVLSAGCGIYYLIHAQRITTRIVAVDALTNVDILFGLAFVLLCIEAARRTIGFTIIAIALLFIAYGLFGHLLGGIWYHHKISAIEMLDHLAFGYNGLWGSPIAVAASFVFIFVLFGSFLKKSGAGEFFFHLSVSLAGRTRGGPAKIAIIASALFGSISGSPTANVVTTGSFTIPTAKKAGYSPKFAAAIEACASTGGSLLPPIMGSSAFLMVAVTGIPYQTVAIAAILPGILFYVSLFSIVHFEALRLNLPKVKDEDIPKLKEIMKDGWVHFIPLIILVVFLIQGYSPSRTGIYGIIAIVIVSMFKKEKRMSVKSIIQAMSDGANSAIPISTACGIAGLVIAGIMTTGLGGKLNSIILSMTAGQLLPSLVLVMIMCIVLGMGMPVAAAYVLTAMLAAPTLISLGVSLLSAHLFIVYFSIISAITPPVAVAAFAAAGIAKTSPMKVGFEAVRLGLASFIIPFMFVYHPALLLDGTVIEIVYVICMSFIGIVVIGCGIVGFAYGKLNIAQRLLLICAGSLTISTILIINLIGIAIVIFFLLYKHKKNLGSRKQLSISLK